MEEWRKLTSKQKIARLDKQLENIDAGITAFKEFRRLTIEWRAKVKAVAKSNDDDDE